MSSAFMGNSPESFDELYAHLKSFPPPLLPPGKAYDPTMADRISSLYVHPSTSPLAPIHTQSHTPPALEALLHLLNQDLPSAHFLVRHMQAAPAVEGMYCHGLLHRLEGDYNNCRAWYADICHTPAFTAFFSASDDAIPAAPSPLSFLAALPPAEREALEGDLDLDDDGGGAGGGPRLLRTRAGDKVPSQSSARCFVSAVEALRRTSASAAGYGERKARLEAASGAEIEALVRFCVDKFGTGKVGDASAVWVQPGEEHRAMGESMVSGGEGYRKF